MVGEFNSNSLHILWFYKYLKNSIVNYVHVSFARIYVSEVGFLVIQGIAACHK